MRPSRADLSVPTIADVICLLSVVSGLCVVQFGLQVSLRAELVFQYGNPTLLTPWTATLVHDSIGHLTADLAGYLAASIPTYVLYCMWGRRRRFWLLTASVAAVVPPLTAAADWWLLYQRWGLAGPQTVGYGFSGVVSGLVGVLSASTVAVVADWYGQQAALTGAVTLVGAGSGGVLLTSGGFSSILSRLFVGGIAVALLAGFGTRVVIGWWHRPHRDHELGVLSTTCDVVAAVMIAALFQIEVAVTPRFVDVLAHAAGMFAGLGLTALYSVGGE